VSGAPSAKVDVKDVASVNDTTPAVDSDIPAPVRAQAANTEALSDRDIAKSYRSQADAMYKEAARLRKEQRRTRSYCKENQKVEDSVDA
jgi:hypothetical protein